MTQKNRITAELQNRAAKLRRKLEATEAEIAEREKTVDWPTARYVWGVVDSKYVKKPEPGLFRLDECDSREDYIGPDGYVYFKSNTRFASATPVTLVPTAEWDSLTEAFQSWKDSYYTAREWLRATEAVRHLIDAAQEMQE